MTENFFFFQFIIIQQLKIIKNEIVDIDVRLSI
jgi:hypothetical protein